MSEECDAEAREDAVSSCSQHEFTTRKDFILCKGKNKDGIQCKAEVQKRSKICKKCGTNVDPQWFSSAVITCQGQRKDEPISGNIQYEKEEFCIKCGIQRATELKDLAAKRETKINPAEACVKGEGSPVDTNNDNNYFREKSSSKLGDQSYLLFHFHVLVSPDFKLNWEKHKVHMQMFIEDSDGQIIKTFEMKRVRQVQGYEEMQICIKIEKGIVFRNGFSYQYGRYNQKKKTMKWEKYYKASLLPGSYRYCHLLEKWKDMSEYHQYDGIMNRGKGAWDYIKNTFTSDHIKKLEEDAGISAEIFTQAKLLSTENMAAMLDPETLIMLDMLLLGLEKRYLHDANCWSSQEGFREKMTTAILPHILKSLEFETETPLFNYTETQQQAERRMQVALFVLFVIGRFKLLLSPHNKSLLARSLLLRPHHETGTFHDFAIVVEKSQKEKRELQAYIIELCSSFQMNDKDPSWLCCIPLLHLLSGVVKSDGPPTDDIRHDTQEPYWWGIQSVKSAAEKFKQCSEIWMIDLQDIIKCLSPLFEVDYFLPRTLMSVLQLSEVEKVIQTKRIPPEVCIATCSHYIKETRSHNHTSSVTENEQIISCTKMLKEFLAKFEAPRIWSHSLLHRHAYLTRGIAEDMVRITSKGRSMPDLLKEVVQIFLEAVALFDTVQEKPHPKEQNELQMLKDVHDEVKRRFGDHIFSRFSSSTDFQHSLKMWEDMLCSRDFKSPAVAGIWNNFIVDDFKKQWQNMRGNNPACESTLMEQYCLLVDSLHPCIQSCLGDLAFEVIPTTYTVEVHQWGESERGHFYRLLSSWFEREWEAAMTKKDMEENRIILHHILNWNPFLHFLRMFYVDERKHLSCKCIEKLQQAISAIDYKIKALDNGEVAIRDLTEMKGADSNFQKLASFIIEKSEGEKKGKRFDIAKALVVRQREVDSYKEQMECARTLAKLCQHIPTVDLKDLDSTVEHLTKKKDLRVKDICQPVSVGTITPDNYYPKITALNLSVEVVNMLEPLQNLYESNIFIKLWSEIGCRAKSASLEEVCEEVWKPVSSKVNKVSQILMTGEIQCREMEEYLGNMYRDDYGKMVQEMISIKVPEAQAEERTKQLMQFRQLETCFDGAKAILEIVEAYELKGDFGVIKTIISKKLATTMQMKEFDDSLFNTCAMLQDFTPEKTSCLNVFIKCKELVLWLRESVRGGLKELKVFVDLASTSAGEGDMEIDKVNCLFAAVTGYAPLIFDIDENSGYKELIVKCEILWKELKADPKLPEKLQDTQRYLEWLKKVKQAHGSVEVTSLKQAEAINSKGIFLVGALESNGDTSMDLDPNSTLRLIVPDQNKDLKCHRWYTIEQLQDLQSRLMLIAWNAEHGRDDVDRFMQVSESMLRLANIFIKLNSAGCVLFRHWNAEFLCKPHSRVCALIYFGQGQKPFRGKRTDKKDLPEVIPKIAGFMENCLEKWKDHIAKKRLEYFELNYFTTDQLVILQQELVKVTSDQFPDIRIYPLLSAVKENCTHEDLVDAMKKALTDIDKVKNEIEEANELDIEDERKKEEKVQIFISAMIEGGNSEKHARAALKHHEPSQIQEGLLWCLENEEEMEIVGGDTGIAEKVKKVNEHAPFQGWKKSEQSVMSITEDIISTLGVSERDIDVDHLIKKLEELWEAFLTSVSSSVRDYLSVEHLGVILHELSEKDERKVQRQFPGSLVQGTPNLILCSKADVLSTVLSIYMIDSNQPLPQADEVLMCTPQTSIDQLDVFLRLALNDTSGKIHCLVNSDLLGFEVSDCTERRLEQYMQQNKHEPQYRLVVICSAENENKSRIITALDKFRRPPLPMSDICHIAEYIRGKLQIKEENAAASVDFENSSVRIVRSWRAGVGKSLYVKRTHEKLAKKRLNDDLKDLVTIRLQGKEIDVSQVTRVLLKHLQPPEATTPCIFHLDIAHEVQEGVDFFLFNLLILGCVRDDYGHVWRRSSRDLYLVETIPVIKKMQSQQVNYVHHVYHLLPYLTCRSPKESLDILTDRQKQKGLNAISQHTIGYTWRPVLMVEEEPGENHRKEPPTHEKLLAFDLKEKDQLFDEKEFQGPVFQRPYQYLSQLDKGGEIKDVNPNTPSGTLNDCLEILLKNCGIPDPSWAELHYFVWFFNTQLMDFEGSIFCSADMAEDLPGFSKFVLKFLIQMSRDFSTRSLKISEEPPTTMMEVDQKKVKEESNHHEVLDNYQMKRKWESSAHPYLFFNPDKHTMTFLGFCVDRETGNLIDQQSGHVLETAIMAPDLYASLVRNRVPLQEDFDSLPRMQKIERLCHVMSGRTSHDPAMTSDNLDPDETYELTTDNVKKILAIYMRFRCNIPVIIMGETGCGKTRLVKFLCKLQTPPGTEVDNLILMKVHGGTTNADIIRKVEEARGIAERNTKNYKDMYTVLFFDEANTTEAIGMIKEVMFDRSIEGTPLDKCENLRFVAACNPYRKHSEDFIKHLEQAGLGYHVDSEKTTDKLGFIPMRQLVYRVQPLPQSLLPLVWDFGQLNTQIEDLYIRQMVKRYIERKRLPQKPGLIETVSKILTASQQFMREQKNECSFVSLRDVERVLDVMSWFCEGKRTLYDKMNKNIWQKNTGTEDSKKKSLGLDDITRSLVLALGACYHACLKNREEYREHVAKLFKAPFNLPWGPDQMEQEISTCQDVFLENVKLEENIAHNTALKENVFMMVICIELRIPLFLVGKPGSSKSLAKTIVADAMQGNAARTDLFRGFKQVHMVSYQCSPLSTPDGIMETFRQCAQFQKDKDLKRFVSVVVLDEVGLAEDSPRMPLKTLHPLLEDGYQGDEKPQQYQKVGFVGISNWALDPAKMNRGILLQREVPDLEELSKTAIEICFAKRHVFERVRRFIEPLARSYLDLFKETSHKFREFFGLRDFYSLVKMICFSVEQASNQRRKSPTQLQLLRCIKRNFGGLDTINPVKVFASRLTSIVEWNAEGLETDPYCTALGLIKASLESDSRYLLLLTENYGALAILQEFFLTEIKFITVFGSSFRSDQEYTQVCRNINRIKVCMETGNTVVLLNLENLYESLYDALNQHYVYFGGERYVDLGLGTHRVKCRVHKNFRLIVIAEKCVVYERFPIPLINRLEKHLLTVNTILTGEQHDVAQKLLEWVANFCREKPLRNRRQNKTRKNLRSVGDVFIGYNADACYSVIRHVWSKSKDHNMILDEAKRLLLWCATPDYVVQLGKSCLDEKDQIKFVEAYMKEQYHGNLAQYLKFKLQTEKEQVLFAQITTHSKLLSTANLSDIHQAVGILPDNTALEILQSFDTESQFSHRIRSFMESKTTEELLLIIQCESGNTNAKLVASARYCIQDEYQQMNDRRTRPCHIVLIIQLPRIAGGCFTGFQCVLWHSAHIDDLVQDHEMPSLTDMLGNSVSTLMMNAVHIEKLKCMEIDSSSSDDNPDQDQGRHETVRQALLSKQYIYSRIMSCVQPALAMIRDREETMERSTQRIELILYLLHENPVKGLPSFLHELSCRVAALLTEKETKSLGAGNWMAYEAAKSENVNKAGTFRQACIQYLDSKIFPVLAGIIAHIDTNHNLDIIRNHISSGDWKARLWLDIFTTPSAIQLQYSDLQSPTKQQELSEVIVKTTGYEGQMFDAVVPFSWLIYEQIDKIWRTTQEEYGQQKTEIKMEKIIGSMKETMLGQVLDSLEDDVSTEDIVHLYVQDFTSIVYHAQKSKEQPEENELVINIIMKTASTLQGNVSHGIVAGFVWIHESHHRIIQYLGYFRSLNEVWPECAAAVKSKLKDPQDSDLLALVSHGLSSLIQQLKPTDLSSTNNQQKWLNKVYSYRPVIEKVLAHYSFEDATKMDAAVVEARHMWTKAVVIKLFIEHVAADEETQNYVSKSIMSLWMILGTSPDLKEADSLGIVEKVLTTCNKNAIKDLLGQEPTCFRCGNKMDSIPIMLPCKDAICSQCFYDMKAKDSKKCPHCSKEITDDFNQDASASQREVQIFKDFQRRCNSFFMDIVSQLCFANNTAPSDQVMDKLLGYITMLASSGKSGDMATHQLTKELTIFNDCVDPNPVFRSFLLHLLLKTSAKNVTAYLEKYFEEARKTIEKDNIDSEMHMVQLCQLVVHCLEDSYYLECTERSAVTIANECLESAGRDMSDSSNCMTRMRFIAKVRFGLAMTAKHIYETILSNQKQKVTFQQQRMIKQAATLCARDWPKKFFIKYLCRCYGQDSYEALCKMSNITYLGWTRYEPEDGEKVREVSDRYIVCGPHYIEIREAVTKVVLGEDIDHLNRTIMDMDKEIPRNKLKILLCLTLHREITMSNLYDSKRNKVKPMAVKMLQKYCSKTEILKNENLASRILQNKYGVQSAFLNVTPGLDLKHQGILCLLIHCDLVLRNLHGDCALMQPLVRLATQPDRMKVSFIPTMPQDDVQEIRQVILAYRGSDNPVFYRCPNGHPYFIGDCGRPWVQSECPHCKAEIGGKLHNLQIDNKHDKGEDLTETGHILGDAEKRTQIGPERTLTTVNCAIIRLLTHLTMMLGANINSQAVSEFIKPPVSKAKVPEFLWKHIEHDLDDLHRALGKSIDDIFIIMHIILSNMMERLNETEQHEDDISHLKTKQARDYWEKRFPEKYVVPIFQNIENRLQECNQQIGKDKRLGSDPLLCLLYEVTQGQENYSLTDLPENPSMWRYQSRITMEHLHREFDVQMTATDKEQHRVLDLFMKKEQHLRMIRYIPSILKLQRILFQKYQRKLGKAEASKITMDSLDVELQCLLDEYAEVWDLVRENLENVPMEYRRERIDISTPVTWFLPTLSGAGLCAFYLLNFLYRTQNDFLDDYYRVIKRREKPHVRVRDITPAHLIFYHPEKDILPLVLANCNYSFEMGKGTTIEYNFANLERQIMDRFLFGKSQIVIEIELMVYRAEYTNATVFRNLQWKIPQVPLRTSAKHKISEELHSVPDLCQALDNLDIAINFLKSIGGKPESNLHRFMVEILKMKQSLLSPKAQQICQYQHVKALWLLLSLEKNKKLAHHNQEIFEGVPDKFREELTPDLQNQVMTFLHSLSVERLEVLLELMFECIILVISVPQNPNDEDYVDHTDKKYKDYLFGLKEKQDMDQNQDTDQDVVLYETDMNLDYELKKFPDEVFNKFCVETWKLANQCLLKKRTHN